MKFYKDSFRKIRNSKKHSRGFLAGQLDISASALCSWETGRRNPKEENVRSLAEFYHIPVNEISDLKELSFCKQYKMSQKDIFWNKLTSHNSTLPDNFRKIINLIQSELTHLPEYLEDTSLKIYAILTAIDIPIYLKSSSGVFVTGNKAFHKCVKLDFNTITNGITEEELPGLTEKESKDNYTEDILLLAGKKNPYKNQKGFMLGSNNTKNAKISKQLIYDNNKISGLVVTYIDITEIVNKGLKLDVFHESLVKNDHFGLILKEEDKKNYIEFSIKAEKILTYTKSEFLLNPSLWKEIIHPDDRPRILKENKEAKKKHEKHENEFRILTKSRKVKWIREIFVSVKNAITHKDCYVYIFSDITKEVKQKEINDLAGDLINTELQQGLWCYRVDADEFIFFNKGHEDNYGYTKKEQIEMDFFEDIVHPDDRDWLNEKKSGILIEIDKVKKGSKLNYKQKNTFRIIHGKTKRIRWIEESIKWVYRYNILYALGISKDVTDEIESRENEKLLMEIMNNHQDFFWISKKSKNIPDSYKFISSNNVIEEIVGIKKEQLIFPCLDWRNNILEEDRAEASKWADKSYKINNNVPNFKDYRIKNPLTKKTYWVRDHILKYKDIYYGYVSKINHKKES
jgi:PAS domain S-box-containing protein